MELQRMKAWVGEDDFHPAAGRRITFERGSNIFAKRDQKRHRKPLPIAQNHRLLPMGRIRPWRTVPDNRRNMRVLGWGPVEQFL
jgi:hypothetical protein